jgi:hypothetical protein
MYSDKDVVAMHAYYQIFCMVLYCFLDVCYSEYCIDCVIASGKKMMAMVLIMRWMILYNTQINMSLTDAMMTCGMHGKR